MKVIITLTFCGDNLWESLWLWKSLQNSGNFFLLLCGHPVTVFLFSWQHGGSMLSLIGNAVILQCLDAAAWASGRASGIKNPAAAVASGSAGSFWAADVRGHNFFCGTF